MRETHSKEKSPSASRHAHVNASHKAHSPEFNPDEIAAPARGPTDPVVGLADIHVHQMSHLAFGGRWIWGDHDGPPEHALRACSGQGLDHGAPGISERTTSAAIRTTKAGRRGSRSATSSAMPIG